MGNLSFYTTEEQIHELFGKSGDIKKVIMGLDKVKKTACGFCFVEYPSAGPAPLPCGRPSRAEGAGRLGGGQERG